MLSMPHCPEINPHRDLVSSLLEGERYTGQTIGVYTLISKIGQGGMGSVWLAERTDGEIEQRVAIKLPTADRRRPAWRGRFLRERRLLASLHHPSIVHVIDAGQKRKTAGLIW